MEHNGEEVNIRIFQMRMVILNLPRLSCHAAKIHMTFKMKEMKTVTTKDLVAGNMQTALGTLRESLGWEKKEDN